MNISELGQYGSSHRFDEPVKSRKTRFFVIPVKTGIQYFKVVAHSLDSRLRGNDDFLRGRHI